MICILSHIMSLLISAMDYQSTTTTMQLGQNGHVERAWSTDDVQEQIMQLYFQLVRTKSEKNNQGKALESQLNQLLKTLSETPTSPLPESEPTPDYLGILYRMLLQTRDTVSGKGEYAFAYRMVMCWYRYFPEKAVRAVEMFVSLRDTPGNLSESTLGSDSSLVLEPTITPKTKPLGSWKDMKYMADVCKQTTGNAKHELIQTCIRLINAQLNVDLLRGSTESISLCAKWVPREGSKYGWLFKALAEDYYAKEYQFPLLRVDASKTDLARAKKCAYTHYRKLLAELNRKLDTVQIKQCGNVWAEIDHHKTTSITLSRNKQAFLNLTKKGEPRSELPDRVACAEHFTEYVESRIAQGKEIKGRHVGMNDFTKLALAMHDSTKTTEKELLNAQWRSNSAAINPKSLGNIVAMVDTSSSMNGDPLHAAIALGIRVAEKSVLGKRVLTFSTRPTWHNLNCKEDKDNFVDMVHSLRNAEWGGSTDFYAALKLILDALVEQRVPPADVEDLVLAVFSDMQINSADRNYNSGSMIDTIHGMYQAYGYTCPHILFWNLTSTSGFPSLSSEPNTSMMSGFSPVLLNAFCEKGVEALQTTTPWHMMLEALNQERYMSLA